MQYYDRPPLTSLEGAQKIVERLHARFERNEAIRWGITLAGDDRLVGNCGYSWQMRHQFAEIGYVLSRAYWKQ